MRIAILGGGDEVGASCLHIDLGECKVLVDGGVRLGGAAEYGAPQDSLPDLARISELGGVDAIFLTHAHLDHSGALPLVHQAYPQAPIYCTTPTARLIAVLLADALRIMEQKAERELEVPLYDVGLVNSMFTKVVPVELAASVPLPNGAGQVHFFPAGHILGASLIGIESSAGNVLVSGDLSVADQRTIPGMTYPRFEPEVLLLESTYGNRMHANRTTEERRLGRAVAEVISAGGKVLIPAFALGRAQEVILILRAMQLAGELPPCPIWVDGMVRSVCEVYTEFPQYLTPKLRRAIDSGAHPFYPRGGSVQPVRNSKEREQILHGPPCCIVASSGMLSGGPSQYYAEQLAGCMENAIFLTGYQDEESPGRRLLEVAAGRESTLRLGDKEVAVRCRIQQFGLSAHADAGELASLVHQLNPPHTILVHGDEPARRELGQRLQDTAVYLVENGDELQFCIRKSRGGRNRGWGEGAPLDLEQLWLRIVEERTLAKRLFSQSELGRLWYGDEMTEGQLAELEVALGEDQLYFVSDRARPYLYFARTKAQVANQWRRRQLMANAPELKGHLLLIRDREGTVECGICYETSPVGFWAWQVGEQGQEFPAEALVAIVAPWDIVDPSGSEEKKRLAEVLQSSVATYRRFTPRKLWTLLFEAFGEEEFTLEEALEACGLVPDLAERVAVTKRLVTSADFVYYKQVVLGENRYRVKAPELVPPVDVEDAGPLDPNAAMSLVDELFPKETGLYKRGAHVESRVLQLYFHFPDVARQRFAARLAELEELTGWRVEVNAHAHQGALVQVLHSLLPEDCKLLKGPSIYIDERKVVLELAGGVEEQRLREKFKAQTGFELVLMERTSQPPAKPPVPSGKRWEINQAFRFIKEHFAWLGVEIYKHSKRNSPDGTEFIQLSFISPEVGERYREEIEELSKELGWPIEIAPEPNQHAIKMAAMALIPPEWGLQKEPSFYKTQRRVEVKLSSPPDDGQWEEAVARFREQTAYNLEYTT